MVKKLETFLERLQQVQTKDDLFNVTQLLRDVYGVENVAYLAPSLYGTPQSYVTYRPEWAQHYERQNYVAIDPVVRGVMRQFHPLDWRRLDWSTKTSREFLGQAVDFGVGRQGLTIPIRGPGGQTALFAVNHNCDEIRWEKFVRDNVNDLMLISHYFHQQILKSIDTGEESETKNLSPREIDVLRYLALGNSRGQTAAKLNISEHTLRVYVDSARYKLGALNTTHAIAVAITKGHIAV